MMKPEERDLTPGDIELIVAQCEKSKVDAATHISCAYNVPVEVAKAWVQKAGPS